MALFTTFSTHDDGDMKHPAVQTFTERVTVFDWSQRLQKRHWLRQH